MRKVTMWEIREYLKNITIIMTATLPLCLVIIKRISGKAKSSKEQAFLQVVFLIYIFALTTQAVSPKFLITTRGIRIIESGSHKMNLIPFLFLKEVYKETIIKGNVPFFLINIIGNTLLFVPIGVCIPQIWKISYKAVLAIGLLYSLFIETTQLFMPRVTDIDDLILNFIGVLIGVLIHKYISSRFATRHSLQKLTKKANCYIIEKSKKF